MDIHKLEKMKGGWFVGDFIPSAFRTKEFEISYRIHPKGEQWDAHYHKEATEINLLIKGSMNMCGKNIEAGDIFIVYPNEISSPTFFEDCEIVCIKTPSVIGDKYVIDKENDHHSP